MKQLLCMVDLYKCRDCKHFVESEYKRFNKKPLKGGYCNIKKSYADKVHSRHGSTYACRAFIEKEEGK